MLFYLFIQTIVNIHNKCKRNKKSCLLPSFSVNITITWREICKTGGKRNNILSLQNLFYNMTYYLLPKEEKNGGKNVHKGREILFLYTTTIILYLNTLKRKLKPPKKRVHLAGSFNS